MRQSAKEYLPLLLRRWWAMIAGILLTFVGVSLDIGQTTGVAYFNVSQAIARTLWIAGLVITGSVAPFLAFHKVRMERDQAVERLRNQVPQFSIDWMEMEEDAVIAYTILDKPLDVLSVVTGTLNFNTSKGVQVEDVQLVMGDDVLISNWTSKKVYGNMGPYQLDFGSKPNAQIKWGKRMGYLRATVDGKTWEGEPFELTTLPD